MNFVISFIYLCCNQLKKRFMKGITSINLAPYDKNLILTVSHGLTREELLDKIKPGGAMYRSKALNIKEIRLRCEQYNQCKVLFEEHDFPSTDKSVAGELCYDTDKGLYFIMLKEIDWHGCNYLERNEFLITVAHEVLHLCQYFLPKYLNRNEEVEAEAYFHSYLMREIIDIFEHDHFW